MSKKKSKAVVFEDSKARLRHHDLQTETDTMRSKLKEANQRKSILAAQVRFLRKRHKYLVTSNNNSMSPSQELKTNVHTRNLLGQTKIPKERVIIADESSQRILPFVPEPKRMKQQDMAEQTVTIAHKKTSLGGKKLSNASQLQFQIRIRKKKDLQGKKWWPQTPPMNMGRRDHCVKMNTLPRGTQYLLSI